MPTLFVPSLICEPLCDILRTKSFKALTIFETFKDYSLTNGQQELLKNLNEFLEDKTSCFLLKGMQVQAKLL
jgi:hypothetical protein